MSEPFLGEIRVFPLNYAPQGWAQCNGQLLPINQNQALYSILGTVYGGNGQTTFALPNLQGRVSAGVGTSPDAYSVTLGQVQGEATHTLTAAEMPMHTHQVMASSQSAEAANPAGAVWAQSAEPLMLYAPAAQMQPMNTAAISTAGGSQGHENLQPYLVLNFCIATQGIYPSRN